MLAALATVPLIMVLGNSMLIPVLPKIKEQLEISQFQVSLLITMFSIPAGITIPLAGFLSDRLTRKIIIAPALIIYGLGGLVAGAGAVFINHSYWVILTGRVLQGIGAAGTAPIAMALAGDIFAGKSRSKALGIIEASNGLGKVLSPILGSLVALVAWYATFFVFPALCVPAALAVWFLVKEPTAKKETKSTAKYFQSLKTIVKTKGGFLLAAFFAGSTVLFLLFGILFYLSDTLESKYHIFSIKKGLVLAIPVLAMSSTSYITGALIQKKVKLQRILVMIGLSLLAVSLGALPWFDNLYLFLGILSVAGIGVGLVLPCLNTIITSSVSMEERGMVTSLYGGVRFIGVALGPPIFGLLMANGKLTMFGGAFGLTLVSLGLVFFLLHPAPKNQASKNSKSSKASTSSEAGDTRNATASAGANRQVNKKAHRKNLGQIFMETITFRNSIGRMVLRKPLPPEETKDIQQKEEASTKPAEK